ncbi:MAG TPA: hypothetical protein PLY80_08090 [Pseudomonadota bacterium]|nr:hypothetical protein [Pseudomonadota bacterium]
MSHVPDEVRFQDTTAGISSLGRDVLAKLLSAVPALCFIHCVGTVLLALALPAAASLWTAGEWLEGPLWLLSIGVVGTLLYRRRQLRGVTGALLSLSLLLGLVGFGLDSELARRISLLGLVALQLLSWQRRQKLALVPVCPCAHHQRLAA